MRSVFPGVFIIIVTIIVYLSLMGFNLYDIGYENGQIDALTGKIKYELVEHLDKTKAWEKIKDKTGE